MSKKVRFGIMCNNYRLADWQIQTIENLLDNENVEIALIINNKSFQKNYKKAYGNIFTIYRKIFLKSKLLKVQSILDESWVTNVELIECKTRKLDTDKYGQYFYEDDIKYIKSKELDFILRFGFNIIRGEILESASYGVWSFHHGDEIEFRGGPPCFWEIYNDSPITSAVLQKLTDELDAGIILKKGIFKTVDFSYKSNLEKSYKESITWPSEVLKYINQNKIDIFDEIKFKEYKHIKKSPTNLQFIYFVIKLYKNKLLNIINHLFFIESWEIVKIEYLDKSVLSVSKIFSCKNYDFAADPFVLDTNNILFEYFDYKKQKGKICNYNIKDNITTDILILNSHLSFPNFIESNGKKYIYPESSERNQIVLHSLNNTNEKIVLMDNIDAVDSEIFFHKNTYFLFTTKKSNNANLNLFLYYSDQLTGRWQAHPLNPIKTDVTSSRMAGKILNVNNKLIRPSMNNSVTYGGSITLNEIIKLSKNEYEEIYYDEIMPNLFGKQYAGIHTINNYKENTYIVDIKQMIFTLNPLVLYKNLKSKFLKKVLK